MSTTPWKPQVRKYNDETTFEPDPLNIPVNDLIQRTDNLHQRLNQLTSKNAVVIESADADVSITGCMVVAWDPVNNILYASTMGNPVFKLELSKLPPSRP